MFRRKINVTYATEATPPLPCPLHWIDNFAMRNFTNDVLFDDTLPTGDGTLEIGNRIPLDRLKASMEDWFRRKSYLKPNEILVLTEPPS